MTQFHGVANMGARMMALEGEIERLQEINAEMVEALKGTLQLIDDLMPGVRHIALRDYALLNDAQIAARKAIAKVESGR